MLTIVVKSIGVISVVYLIYLLMKKDSSIKVVRNRKLIEEEKEINDRLHAVELSNKEKFDNIMKCARDILNLNDDISVLQQGKFTGGLKYEEHPIFDFIRILGRGIQSDYIKAVLYYDMDSGEHNIPNLEWNTVGFDERIKVVLETGENIRFDELLQKVDSSIKICLSKDLILPWPWMRARLINTIKNIGQGRKWGMWRQDNKNHCVTVWLPMGLCWVNGGNHSIAVGIVQGGEIVPNEYYDISKVYKYIQCDGENFIRTYTNNTHPKKIIAPVVCVEFAAIFEIGRLLAENKISFVD